MDKSILIQNQFQRFLESYLSGYGLSNCRRLAYPLGRNANPEKEWRDIFKRGEFSELRRLWDGDLCRTFARVTEELRADRNDVRCRRQKKIVKMQKQFRAEDYPGERCAPLRRLADDFSARLAPFLAGALIHGSLATLDFTGYSDLDILIILKNEVLRSQADVSRLRDLVLGARKYLYQFDPLQHHGFFILTEFDLKFYGEAYLPLTAIESGCSLLGRAPELTFFIRDSRAESVRRYYDAAALIKEYLGHPDRLSSAYYFKVFLSHVMIVPALYLQARNRHVSKKESFPALKDMVPGEIWPAMEAVSLIRQNWTRLRTARRMRMMAKAGDWNPFVLPVLAKKYRLEDLGLNRDLSALLKKIEAFIHYLDEQGIPDATSGGLREPAVC